MVDRVQTLEQLCVCLVCLVVWGQDLINLCKKYTEKLLFLCFIEQCICTLRSVVVQAKVVVCVLSFDFGPTQKVLIKSLHVTLPYAFSFFCIGKKETPAVVNMSLLLSVFFVFRENNKCKLQFKIKVDQFFVNKMVKLIFGL